MTDPDTPRGDAVTGAAGVVVVLVTRVIPAGWPAPEVTTVTEVARAAWVTIPAGVVR